MTGKPHWTREQIRKQIRETGLIPSVRVDSAEAAIFASEQVAAGGIPIVEIAATIPDSDQVIRDLTGRFPKLIVGAEVISGLDEAHRKLDSGAMFLTGPGYSQRSPVTASSMRSQSSPGRSHPPRSCSPTRRAPIS